MTDEEYWAGKVEDAKRGQLDTVRKTATAWSGLFSALFGVFGVVAVAGGLQDFGDLAPDYSAVVQIGTSVAAVALAVATFYAAKAAGLTLATSNDTTWQQYRDSTIDRAQNAKSELGYAKVAGLIAVGIGLALGFVAIWGPSASASPATVIVDTDKGVACGELAKRDGTYTIDGKPVKSVASLSVVSKCP